MYMCSLVSHHQAKGVIIVQVAAITPEPPTPQFPFTALPFQGNRYPDFTVITSSVSLQFY